MLLWIDCSPYFQFHADFFFYSFFFLNDASHTAKSFSFFLKKKQKRQSGARTRRLTLSKNPVLVPRHADDLSLQVCKLHYRHQCEMNGQFQASDQEEENNLRSSAVLIPRKVTKRGKKCDIFLKHHFARHFCSSQSDFFWFKKNAIWPVLPFVAIYYITISNWIKNTNIFNFF